LSLKSKKAFFFFTFLILVQQLQSEEDALARADQLEQQGDREGALAQLKGWLSDNTEDPSFPAVLDRYSRIDNDLESQLTVMVDLAGKASRRKARQALWEKIAVIADMAGRLELAQSSYHAAAILAEGERSGEFYLFSAGLLYELGEWDRARDELSHILVNPPSDRLYGRALVLAAHVAAAIGETEKAEKLYLTAVEKYTDEAPRALLGLIVLNGIAFEEADGYLARLKELAPQSPEYDVARTFLGEGSRIGFVTTPHRFLLQGPRRENTDTGKPPPAERIGIQTGSFLDRENAQDMAKELEERQFEVTIASVEINRKLYHRVVVGEFTVEKEARLTQLKLKEQGFEGDLIYY
jgi:tetratricopeptide (TPR) repeat protein